MNCKVKCSTKQRDHQPFPRTGPLVDNMNLQLDALRKKITIDQATVYYYVIATIENREEYFAQTGSAPNFQGGLVTLCTCKHYMRTFLDINVWRDKWIAGFTGVKAGGGRNSLVYLMQVSCAFESHQDLWFANDISLEMKQAKAAHLDKFGDIYQPQSQKTRERFNPQDYVYPHHDHVHAKCWENDIDYKGCSDRVAALLVGNPEYSFLWDQPTIFSQFRFHRGQKKCELGYLLNQLER